MAEEFSISEWLKKAKEDPKVAAQPLVIVLALAFGGYKGLYAPKALELVKEDRKTKGIEASIRGVQDAVDNIEDIRLDIEDKKAALSKAIKLCYRKSEMTAFLRRVRELAAQAGIPVKSVNPQPLTQHPVAGTIIEKCPVSFTFSGDLVQLGIFLRLIEKEEKVSFVEMPTLSPNASGTFEIELKPTTILIPDELAARQL
jgi:Tfp pilus assembly protein PilO